MDLLLNQLANGLVLGSLYALIAVGLSIIFGILGIVNFAHGVFFALGAYLAVEFTAYVGWFGLVLAPIAVGILGALLELTIVKRLYRAEPLLGLIVTVGLAFTLEAAIREVWGPVGIPFSPPEALKGFIEFGPLFLTRYRVAVIVAAMVLLALFWGLLNFTSLGRIIRAGSRDPEMISLLGINIPHVLTFAFSLGCALAAAAGVLSAPLWSITPTMGALAIMPAFVIITIGGLGSYVGSVIGAYLVGIINALCVQYLPQASGIAMYVLMGVVILLRPRGLLGQHWERFE